MTDEPTCARCSRPMQHDTALVCSRCTQHLARRLELVARIAGDITLTVARLDVVTRSGSGQVDDLGWDRTGNALEPMALLPDLDRAQRHDAAVNELAGWARIVAEERGAPRRPWAGHVDRPPSRLHPLAELARGLADNLEWLRHHPAADQAIPDLLAACDELERAVDTQVNTAEIVGLCGCGSALYGPKCNRCGATESAYTRADIDAAKENYAVTASEAAAWIARSGIVTDSGKLRDMIYKWRDRGFLVPVDETPRYRFGDVLDRVMASPALRAA